MSPKLVLIAAVGRSGELGAKNQLLWHLPEDLAHFKSLTLGKPVLMGRKTWDSLPPRFRPLPGRRNLVLSRQPEQLPAGAEGFASMAQALSSVTGEPELWVIGGAALYALALPLATRVELTEVDADFPQADCHWPTMDAQWRELEGQALPAWQTAKNGLRYRFRSFTR